MILMIDNYDSFTYNLVQYIGELGEDVEVVRNDKITLKEIENMAPSHIIISPGPCTPNEAGISLSLIEYFKGKIPILGVCLGHQTIGQSFGGTVSRAPELMHGKTSEIIHDGKTLFKDVPNPFTATRYHSLIIEEHDFPNELEVSARTQDGMIMGLRHKKYIIEGVQFHPESIMTQYGLDLLRNFIKLREAKHE